MRKQVYDFIRRIKIGLVALNPLTAHDIGSKNRQKGIYMYVEYTLTKSEGKQYALLVCRY